MSENLSPGNYNPVYVEFDGKKFQLNKPRIGDKVAFYSNNSDRKFYRFGFITAVLEKGRVHLRLFDGNGTSIRKRVDMADGNRFQNRYLPLNIAHTLEDIDITKG